MPQQPQMDISFRDASSRQRGNESVSPYEASPNQNLPQQGVEARGQEFASVQQGLDQTGAAVQDIAQNQIDAQHQIYLTKAHTDYQLQAQKTLDDIKRNAQPGQSIVPEAEEALNKLQQTTMGNVQSPTLQAALSTRTGGTNAEFLSQAQAYDFKARDEYVKYNYGQSIIGAGDLIKSQPDPQSIQSVAMNKLGELLHTADSAPIDPDQRLAMKLDATKQIGMAASYASQLKDSHGWLTEHAYSLTPEARGAMPDSFSRGIRNNNPGNLTGDDQWQGLAGKDSGGYLKFDTPENGLRALSIDLRNQQDKHGLDTVADIITKYAPPDKNDTASYIKAVSSSLDVAPNQKIDLHDPETMHRMMDAVIKHENGGNPFSNQTGQWAANEPNNPAPTAPPDTQMPHGGTRTGDPLFNMLPLETQHQMVNEALQVQHQERSLSADDRRMFTTNYAQYKQDVGKGIPLGDADTNAILDLAKRTREPSMMLQAAELIDLSNTSKALGRMNPQDVSSYISQLRSMPDDVMTANKIKLAETFQNNQQEQIKNNPLEYFARQGNDIPPVDFNKPQNFQQRAAIAKTLISNYGASADKAYFTPQESNQIVQSFNGADPNTQRIMLQNFAKGFGSNTPDAASIFSKTNPSFSYAASMLTVNPNGPDHATVQTAMDMIAGEKRIKEDKDNKLIPRSTVDATLHGEGYDKMLTPQNYDQLVNATQAVYAGRNPSEFIAGGGDTKNIKAAAQDAVGGEKARIGNDVIAPPGIKGDLFESYIKNINAAQLKQALWSGRQYMTGEPDAALPGGGLMMPKSSRGFFVPGENKMVLRSVGPGLYEMLGEDGKPYISQNSPNGYALLRFDARSMRAK